MKGNVMMRLISLMILVPAALAHFTGQVDLSEPSWLWLSIFAGLNALQSTFTGFCPPCKVINCGSGSCSTDSCSPAESQSECCPPKEGNSSSCCSGTDDKKKDKCC